MRSCGRPKRKPRVNTYGEFYGMGKQSEDAISGFYFPISQMKKSRSGLVSEDERDGSVDKPDSY